MNKANNKEKHIPIRSCIVCHTKSEKYDLLRFAQNNNKEYILDRQQIIQKRGIYICKNHSCLKKLSLNNKYEILPDDLIKALKLIKPEEKNFLNLLKVMKNSKFLVFGMEMVEEEIKHVHFMVIAKDLDEKNKEKLLSKARANKIKYIFYGTRIELGEIFNKEKINVIAIKNKKIARGLIIQGGVHENKSS